MKKNDAKNELRELAETHGMTVLADGRGRPLKLTNVYDAEIAKETARAHGHAAARWVQMKRGVWYVRVDSPTA